MSDNSFFTPRYTGKRFNGTLPLSVLEDLAAYEELLFELAKHLYVVNTNRKRVPNGFYDGLSLQLSDIEKGSSIPKILLVGTMSLSSCKGYLEQARDQISQIIELAGSGQKIDKIVPTHLLKKFNKIGKTLIDGESIEFTPNAPQKSILTNETRRTIILSSGESSITEKITFRANVTAYDKLSKECTIRSGDTIIKFTPAVHYIKLLLDCYNGYEGGGNKILVMADVKIDKHDKILSISRVHSIDRLDPLDIPSRIEDLKKLNNGWLDGQGLAIKTEGVNWFSTFFGEKFTSDLPLPYLFPTPDGNIQLEWNSESQSLNIEIDLETKKGISFQISKVDKKITESELDLNNDSGWSKLNSLVSHLV